MIAGRATAARTSVRTHLAHSLAAEPVPWRTVGLSGQSLLTACARHGVTALVHRQVQRHRDRCDWPDEVTGALADRSRLQAAREVVRRREIASVLVALGDAGIVPILLKGTPLAYTTYDEPSLRPRVDTDLLVPRERIEDVRRIMAGLGYGSSRFCDYELVFGQFGMHRTDEYGVRHAFDVHWRISTHTMFANVLTYDELAAGSVPVPALGPAARTAGTLHALLLACFHPAMHHRNDDCLVWTLDVHLLATRLSAARLPSLAELALQKRVAAVCSDALRRSTATFATVVPSGVMARLEASAHMEPSAVYLKPARRWHNDLIANLRGLPGWRSRLTLLREIVFPSARYMKRLYAVTDDWRGFAWLPLLYLHRSARSAWKVLAGLK